MEEVIGSIPIRSTNKPYEVIYLQDGCYRIAQAKAEICGQKPIQRVLRDVCLLRLPARSDADSLHSSRHGSLAACAHAARTNSTCERLLNLCGCNARIHLKAKDLWAGSIVAGSEVKSVWCRFGLRDGRCNNSTGVRGRLLRVLPGSFPRPGCVLPPR